MPPPPISTCEGCWGGGLPWLPTNSPTASMLSVSERMGTIVLTLNFPAKTEPGNFLPKLNLDLATIVPFSLLWHVTCNGHSCCRMDPTNTIRLPPPSAFPQPQYKKNSKLEDTHLTISCPKLLTNRVSPLEIIFSRRNGAMHFNQATT